MKRSQTAYPLVGVDPCPQPPRSTLYGLSPFGIGTAECENLRSYLSRLAHEHCVTPSTLTERIIFPSFSPEHQLIGKSRAFDTWKNAQLSGVGKAPRRWTESLTILTGVPDLRYLTLEPVSAALTSFALLKKREAFCPLCLIEEQRNGASHHRLLWDIQAVTACPLHDQKLVNFPGCSASKQIPMGKRKHFPGYCPNCGKPLQDCVGFKKAEAASQIELRTSKLVGEFIGQMATLSETATREGVKDFISLACRETGSYAKLGRLIGVKKSQVHGWLVDGVLPQFGVLLALADAFDVSIFSVMTGCFPAEKIYEARESDRRPGQCRTPKKVLSFDEKVSALCAALAEEPPPSVATVSRRLGISRRTLYNVSPEQVRNIAIRYQEFQRQETIRKHEELMAKCSCYVSRLLEKGIAPSRKQIAKISGGRIDFLSLRQRCALQDILRKLGTAA